MTMRKVDAHVRDGVTTYIGPGGIRHGSQEEILPKPGGGYVLCFSTPFHDENGCYVRFTRPGKPAGRAARNAAVRAALRREREERAAERNSTVFHTANGPVSIPRRAAAAAAAG